MRPILTITKWILSEGGRRHTPAARLVALALAKHADVDGNAWPGLDRLAGLVGIQKRSLRNILDALTTEDGPFTKGPRRGPRPVTYTIRVRRGTHSKSAPRGAVKDVNECALQCQKSAPYEPKECAVECAPNNEEQVFSSSESRDVASRPTSDGQKVVQEAYSLWAEKLGFAPTWGKGKAGWAVLHTIRERSCERFLPAVKQYLATDSDFYRDQGWPPKLLLKDLDGILRKVRGTQKAAPQPRFAVRELRT